MDRKGGAMDKKGELYTFGIGENFHIQNYFGVHREQNGNEEGFVFRVWAPNAEDLHLIGDFSNWSEKPIQMTKNEAGVWEVFTTLPQEGQLYKYLVKRKGGKLLKRWILWLFI